MGVLGAHRGRGAVGRPRRSPRRPPPVRLHARGTRPLPQAAGRSTSSSTSAGSRACRPRRRAGRRSSCLERFGLADRGEGARREALARQPAAGADHRGADGRRRSRWCSTSRSPGSTRPPSTRWPTCCASRPPAACRCCSPGTSSTSSSGSATGSSSWPAAGSSPAVRPTSCGTARPARRYRLVVRTRDAGWVRDVAASHVVDVDGRSAVCSSWSRPAPSRPLLREALRAGTVREFSPVVPASASSTGRWRHDHATTERPHRPDQDAATAEHARPSGHRPAG